MSDYPDYASSLEGSHPIKTYFDEGKHLIVVLNELLDTDAVADFEKFFNVFNELGKVELRYARKENQLFPYLEKHGWTGPSQGMWAFHDANRDIYRRMRSLIEDKEIDERLNEYANKLAGEIYRLLQVETSRLFPYALELLNEEDWSKMQAGEEEIGWMHKEMVARATLGSNQEEKEPSSDSAEGFFKLDEGLMSLEQIKFLLKVIPVDLTYVDENDRVIFYNRGEERVFPRSPGVIGREVRFCHPPKSVDTVLRILEEFRAGTKDEAEFWIQFRGRMVHIRYFAVRDVKGIYKGVIEMSQDITNIKMLEGEQRF